MRDPNRIDETLKKIEVIWKRYPDLRLCQLLENAIAIGGRGAKDMFYVEDDDLNEALNNILKNGF